MNKTVLITGASSGFGRLIAHKFHGEDWNVIATMRSPEKEEELTQLDNVLVTQLDVTDQTSIDSAISEGVEKFGQIDALINNAGYGGFALFEQFSDADARAMFDTNIFGVMATSRAVLPSMRANGSGCIINITSIAGFFAGPLVSIYSASKYAVEGLTESMAFEYEPLGIKVRSVAPGSFGTGFLSAALTGQSQGDTQLNAWGNAVSEHIQSVRTNMRAQGGSEPDPALVAEEVYQCVTEKRPVHNVAGADATMMRNMRESLSHQEYLDKMKVMMVPAKFNKQNAQTGE